MRIWMLAAAAGIAVIDWLPVLPQFKFVLPVVLLLPLPLLAGGIIPRSLSGFAFGCLWELLSCWNMLGAVLPPEWERRDFGVEGYVASLPRVSAENGNSRTRFDFVVSSTFAVSGGETPPSLKRIRLSWYGTAAAVEPGQNWRFIVRLKRPRSFSNPGGSDYAAYLLAHGLGATGYIRTATPPQQLSGFAGWAVHHFVRFKAGQWLNENFRGSHQATLAALSIGDRRSLQADHRQLLQDTGTAHLLAISGLHIGFVAMLCFKLGSFAARWMLFPLQWFPAPMYGALMALMGSTVYAALAGFALPTRRALIMVVVVMLAVLLRRKLSFSAGFCLALLAVQMQHPLTTHLAGFWLSFIAVAALLCEFGLHRRQYPPVLSWFVQLLRAQFAVTLALILPLGIFFKSVPIISPLANLLAIPLVSLLVVPLTLAGMAMIPWSTPAQWLLTSANFLLEFLFVFLEGLQRLIPIPPWTPSTWNIFQILAAATGIAAALCLQRWRFRILALLLLLPLLWPLGNTATEQQLRVQFLDVGQGLAVVVQTPAHTLVYDTGARIGSLDAARLAIIPALRAAGISRLDMLLISHSDGDHAGGAASLLDTIPTERIVVGDYQRTELELPQPQYQLEPCIAGTAWEWDGVYFELLHPAWPHLGDSNANSCVLLISYGDIRFLLPGDIGRRTERLILTQGLLGGLAPLAVLAAPHHGSSSSSSMPFIRALQPRYVLYSSGWLNRYGHPSQSVQERYQRVGSEEISTATAGAVEFRVSRQGKLHSPTRWRERRRHFWQMQ